MQISEKLDVIIGHHPCHESLKQPLLDDSVSAGYHIGSPYKGRDDTSRFSKHTNSKSITTIGLWVNTLIRNKYLYLDPQGWRVKMGSCWFTTYGKGDYTVPHDHEPGYFSWVYFVDCPKGSSPLVFTKSGKRINAEEGKVVIFRSLVQHHCPKNNSDRRVVLVGNTVIFTEEELRAIRKSMDKSPTNGTVYH